MITCNHFSPPGFGAWWIVLAISAVVEAPIHWVITAGLTFRGRWFERLITPASFWAIRQVAGCYGFTGMPPMPPRLFEVAARARAVREVLSYAKREACPLIGLAPEGGDTPGAILQMPFNGAGRFLSHLSQAGLPFFPAGVFLENGALSLNFGRPYRLEIPGGLAGEGRDEMASRIVMQRIACLLPTYLRGEFDECNNAP